MGMKEEFTAFGRSHMGDVFKDHVTADGPGHGLYFCVGKSEPTKKGTGDFFPDLVVVIKVDSALGVYRTSHGFPHVMEQYCPGEKRIVTLGKVLEHEVDMGIKIAFGMIVWGLGAADEGGDFGEEIV